MSESSFTILTVVVCCSGILFASPFAHALLYDFEDKAQEKDWDVTDGQGSVEESVFELQSAAEGQAIVGDVNWTDYAITCKVEFLDDANGDSDAGIMYRVKDGLTHYICDLNLQQGLIWAARINGSYVQAGPGMIVPFAVQKNQIYELKVEVKGDDMTDYVDGEELLVFSHKQLQKNEILDTGAVGVRIWNSHAVFDDFEVNGPGIKLSGAAVSPAGKLAITWGCLKF